GLEQARALSGTLLDGDVVARLADIDTTPEEPPEGGSLEDRVAALVRLATACQHAQDHLTAQRALDEARTLARQSGDRELLADCEMRRAFLMQQRGDTAGAR